MKKSIVAGTASFTTISLALVLLSGCGMSANKGGGLTINAPAQGLPPGAGSFRAQKSRDVKDFHAVDSSAVCTLVISVGQPFSVVVEADESVIPLVKTDVKNGVLEIRLDKNTAPNVPVRLLISMPAIDKLDLSGVGEVTLTGVKSPSLSIKESGAGSCSATGTADMVDLVLSGVGSANLKDLNARALTALLSGTGSAHVHATESLTATLSGIGSLKYSGNPPKLQKKVSGIGEIVAE